MKKFYLNIGKFLFLMCLFLPAVSRGQAVAEYGVTTSQGAFVPLVGGISNNFQGTLDEGAWQGLSIGFPFSYEGVTYTTASASTNGFVRLGTDIDLMFVSYINNLSSDMYVPGPVIAPLWDDLLTGTFSYLTTGPVGNRVFTMEWLNVKWDKSAAQGTISFQVKLYENNNKIEFVYRKEAAGGNLNRSASIGIAGNGTGANSFLSCFGIHPMADISASTEISTIATDAISGLTFTFDYTFIPLNVSSIDKSSVILEWGYKTTNVTWQLEKSTDNINFAPVGPPTTVGSFTEGNLTYESVYYYRLKRQNAPWYSEVKRVTPHTFAKYAMTPSQGQFVPLVGAQQTNSTGSANSRMFHNIPIGFEFPYAGTTHTKLQASIQGNLQFVNRIAEIIDFKGFAHPLQTGIKPTIAVFGSGSLDSPDANYKVSYQTSGVSPNRVFTIEWLNLYWPLNAGGPVISFQAKLYESGKIEFVYEREASIQAANASEAIIGIKGYSLGEKFVALLSSTPNPTVRCTNDNYNIETRPLTGQVYTFEYNGVPSAPKISSLDNSSVTLFWGNQSSTLIYTLQEKIGGGSFQDVNPGPGTNNYLIRSGLSAGVNYYYRVKTENSPWSDEVLAIPGTFSQLYTFKPLLSVFEPLVGGNTSITTGNIVTDNYNNLPIGFSFPFGGSSFSTVSANEWGIARLGRDQFDNWTDGIISTPSPLSNNTSDFFLAPLAGNQADAQLSYKTSGVTPKRTFTMEWLNSKWNGNSPVPVISYQIRLHETTGMIEYIYNSEAGNVVSGNASIGIRNPGQPASGHFFSVQGTGPQATSSTSQEASFLGVKPISGQKYIFMAPGTPLADNQNVNVNEDSSVPITLTGSQPNFTITKLPSHGQLTGVAPNVTYQPNPNYFGSDYFFFTVNDGSIDSPEATVFINVIPVDDAPTASNVAVDMQITETHTFVPAEFNFSDVDGNTFAAIKIVTAETQGDLEFNATDVQAGMIYTLPGILVFKPDAHLNSSFTFQVKDSNGTWSVNTYTANITVHCTAPKNLKLTDITPFSASLSWDAVPGVPAYELQYRDASWMNTWSTWATNLTTMDLLSLDPGIKWEARVTSLCYSSERLYSDPLVPFETPAYCMSAGQNVSEDWIEQVKFDFAGKSTPNLIDNKSGPNGGYAFFKPTYGTYETYTSQSYALEVTPGGKPNNLRYFDAWIDYNQDGKFDASEKVMHQAASTLNTQIKPVIIPIGAKPGTTVMRVIVANGEGLPPEPCDIIKAGEVEDYRIEIVNKEPDNFKSDDGSGGSSELVIYPNPADESITVQGTFRESVLEIRDEASQLIDRIVLSGTDPQVDLTRTSMRSGNAYYLTVDALTTRIVKK